MEDRLVNPVIRGRKKCGGNFPPGSVASGAASGAQPAQERGSRRLVDGVPGALKKWGHYPKLRGHGPIFSGSWRLQVDGCVCVFLWHTHHFAGPSILTQGHFPAFEMTVFCFFFFFLGSRLGICDCFVLSISSENWDFCTRLIRVAEA